MVIETWDEQDGLPNCQNREFQMDKTSTEPCSGQSQAVGDDDDERHK